METTLENTNIVPGEWVIVKDISQGPTNGNLSISSGFDKLCTMDPSLTPEEMEATAHVFAASKDMLEVILQVKILLANEGKEKSLIAMQIDSVIDKVTVKK